MSNHSENHGILRAFVHACLCVLCFAGLLAVTACVEQIEVPDTDQACRDKTAGNPDGAALLQAITDKDLTETKRLIEAGADINYQDEQGTTPLMAAVRSYSETLHPNYPGKDFVTPFLAQENLCVNTRDKNGNTALILVVKRIALSSTLTPFYQLKGIDANIKDNNGNTALWWAAYQNHLHRFNSILSIPGVNTDPQSHINKKKQTLLHALVLSHTTLVNRPELVKLIEKIATIQINPNTLNEGGNTPLMLVAKQPGGLDLTRVEGILKIQGIDINVQNAAGNTALHLCAKSTTNPDLLGRFTRFQGIKINLCNNAGETAWDILQARIKAGPFTEQGRIEGLERALWSCHGNRGSCSENICDCNEGTCPDS